MTKSGTKPDLQQLNVRVPKDVTTSCGPTRTRPTAPSTMPFWVRSSTFRLRAGARRRSTRSFRFYSADGNLKQHHDIPRHLARPWQWGTRCLAHLSSSSAAARRTSRSSSPITSDGTGSSAQNITVSSSLTLQVAIDALCSAPRASGKLESD